MEIWKNIPGYEGLYEVSNTGKIRNRHGKILKCRLNKWGYCNVTLSKNNTQNTYSVHRLVYISFMGEIPEGYEVNHINEIKTDNRLENLNILTRAGNNRWGTHYERVSKAMKGRLLNRSDQSKKIVQLNRNGEIIHIYPSLAEAERKTGVSDSSIWGVCNGYHKTAGGFKWCYAS